MDGMVILYASIVIGLLFACMGLWEHRHTQRLQTELTAYVAEGTLDAATAKAILETKAPTDRKRDVAAHIAEGMPSAEGLALLEAMPTT